MIWLAVCLSMLVPLCTVAVLAFLGFRGGDHPGDAMLELGEPDGHRAVVKASVVNPSKVPVLVGLSVRGRDIRSWIDGGYSIALPRRKGKRALLSSRHSVVGIVAPGETGSWLVPLPWAETRSLKLVAAIGQADRLRVTHRLLGRPALL